MTQANGISFFQGSLSLVNGVLLTNMTGIPTAYNG